MPDLIRVGPLEELRREGVKVVRGADRPIAVFIEGDRAFAVDNRCPHLGFPLKKGSVKDGILTCHWHHARFDLRSGCTFDLFADDVPAFDTEVRDGVVYVAPLPRGGNARGRLLRRLREGMESNLALIQAKSIIALLRGGADAGEIIAEAARFGVENRDDWASGLTVLAAMANLVPALEPETAYLALVQACDRVANDCAGRPPRRERPALDAADLPSDQLDRWLRYWTLVRHRDGAERTLRTAIAGGMPPARLAALLLTAATDRFYAAGGHLLDFTNKALELLDRIGWEHAPRVLPALTSQLVAARGGEESNAWRHPVDLVPPLTRIGDEIETLFAQGAGKAWDDARGLARAMLGEDPLAIFAALREAILAGARPEQLGRALAYAAALRVARFSTANEAGDWFTALHTFSYAHAVHAALVRCPTPLVARGVFHGAASIYLDRFLNIPPAPLPGERTTLDSEPGDADALLQKLRGLMDRRDEVDGAARVVARYLRRGHPAAALLDTLAAVAVREDIDFHALQMLEAGAAEYRAWAGQPEAEHFLVATARLLAAFCPTRRALHQTATIALRLHRGDNLYEDA